MYLYRDVGEIVELTRFQTCAIDRIVKNDFNAVVCSYGGSGKSLLAIGAMKRMAGSIAIVAPANLLPQWMHLCKINKVKADFLSSQKLARDGNNIKGYQYIVVDEIGEFTSKSKAFTKLRNQKNAHKIVLSATPIRNKIENWFGITRLVFPDFFPKGYNYYKWAYEWCITEPIYYGATQIRILGWKNKPFWQNLPCLIDSPEPVYSFEIIEHTLHIELTDEQKADIEMLENRNIIYKNGYFDIPSSIMSKRHKKRYIENAEISLDENRRVYYDASAASPKVDLLLKLLPRLDNALIICKSLIFAELLHGKIRENYKDTVLVTGDMDKAVRSDKINAARFAVCQVQSMSVGIDSLQTTKSCIIYAEDTEDDVLKQQAAWRIVRQGQQAGIVYVVSLQVR
jgi:superfamily II DNA or RNA helicase